MFEVVETHHPDGKVSHHVEEITVTRFGISPGCSAPSISFTRGRQRGLGSVSLFYFDRAEADLECYGNTHGWLDGFTPSTNRDQGYEILEREKIDVMHIRCLDTTVRWEATADSGDTYLTGDTPLIAGLRVCVHSELGEEVDVPTELLTRQQSEVAPI
jgi:hypothetical protein